ncbi:MAG: GntR family transcriptional regulator [Ancalomicrobiaceae bacterium]|nr:GntR family transcriptional regulator [Ancalomicrobiaceae bacterium]
MIEDANITDAYAFLAPINLPTRGGTTDHVTTVLRDAIVTSGLPPGALINKHVICERLGVSRFPVSEALNRLQTEGLVEILPQRGTRVTKIRISDVEESMFIRRALEAETVRQLAPQASEATLTDLERNMRYQQSAIDADDRQGFHMLDLEFHRILMEALAYGRVRATIDSARANLERARRILLGMPGYVATYSDHLNVYEAMVARDGEGAAVAMTAHLNRVMSELVAFSKSRPEVFEPMD